MRQCASRPTKERRAVADPFVFIASNRHKTGETRRREEARAWPCRLRPEHRTRGDRLQRVPSARTAGRSQSSRFTRTPTRWRSTSRSSPDGRQARIAQRQAIPPQRLHSLNGGRGAHPRPLTHLHAHRTLDGPGIQGGDQLDPCHRISTSWRRKGSIRSVRRHRYLRTLKRPAFAGLFK
jgi:hypothetical protein